MKWVLLFSLLPGCLSQVLPVGDPGEEIDSGYDSDSNIIDTNIYSDINSIVETSKELDSYTPIDTNSLDTHSPPVNYFNCNGDPCVVDEQFCCWFEITSWHCVSSLDGGMCKYPKTCGHADDCKSGQKCCQEIATGIQACKVSCVAVDEKEL